MGLIYDDQHEEGMRVVYLATAVAGIMLWPFIVAQLKRFAGGKRKFRRR